MKKRILILEDGQDYQVMLRASLSKDFEVSFASKVSEAMEMIQRCDYDLFILDIVLPDGDGLQFCSYLKSQEHLASKPVIVLTSKQEVEEKIKGFHLGADDYVTKPFHFEELKARVHAKLRLYQGTQLEVLHIEGFKVEIPTQRVYNSAGNLLELTRLEFKLLVYFCQRRDHVLSRQQILDAVWSESLNVTERTVDSHISNLRKKLGVLGQSIKAVHGSGYRFSPPQSESA